MLDTVKIKELAAAAERELIEMRNFLHTIPEIGGLEFETSAFAEGEMKKLGLATLHLTETCFVAELDTGRPGPVLAMRADMDGLPLPESPVNKKGIAKPTVSKHPDRCHACGHDGHTAILINAARILAGSIEALPGGKIYFVFEAGEENGASSLQIRDWVKAEKPDGMWALHLGSECPTHKISLQAGPRCAGISSFKFKAVGRGGHSSRPDQSINPLPAAAEAVLAMQTIVPLNTDPTEMVTLAVCGMNGGQVINVIPDEVEVLGSYRFFNPDMGDRVAAVWPGLVTKAIESCRCKCEIIPTGSGPVPVVNDAAMSAIGEGALRKLHPEMEYQLPAASGSESMGLYFREVPGCFAWVGTGSEELGTDAAHHNSLFDLDLSMLLPALELSVQFAVDFLGKEGK